MKFRKQKLAVILSAGVLATTVSASQIWLDRTVSLSAETGAPAAENAANKGKILASD